MVWRWVVTATEPPLTRWLHFRWQCQLQAAAAFLHFELSPKSPKNLKYNYDYK